MYLPAQLFHKPDIDRQMNGDLLKDTTGNVIANLW